MSGYGIMDSTLRNLVHQQKATTERFGLGARQELNADQVGYLCVYYAELEATHSAMVVELLEARNALADAKAQVQAQAGKIGGLTKQLNKVKKDV